MNCFMHSTTSGSGRVVCDIVEAFEACGHTVNAAENAGRRAETLERIRKLARGFVPQVLDHKLGT